MWVVDKVAGDRVTRVAMDKVRTITDSVHLNCGGGELGLRKSENAAGKWIPHRGAL